MTGHRSIEFIVFLAFNALGLTISEENGTKILFVRYNELGMLDLNTSSWFAIGIAATYEHFVAYHDRYEYIYWTDYDNGKIYRMKYQLNEFTELQVISEARGGQRPFKIVVDSMNDLLYWTDDYSNTIMRSELDGSNQTVILNGGIYTPSLAIDPVNRWLYFVENNNLGYHKIVRSNEDGSSKQDIIIGNTYNVYGITLDPEENRLYWTTYNDIKSAFINGSDEKTVYSSSNTYHIDVFENHVYFIKQYYYYSFELYRIDKSGSDLKYLYNTWNGNWWWWWWYSWSTDFMIYHIKIDGCNKYKEIRSAEKRSTGYIMNSAGDVLISDDNLEENFYRVFSRNGDQMSSIPPGVNHCGTVNPIWLNGTLPRTEDGNVTRTACLQTARDMCEETIEIEIRNCNKYYIYYLKNTTAQSAYCFGSGPVLCPDGQSSESGYYPGCSTSFPKETMQISVEAVLIDGPSYDIPSMERTPSMIPVFKCTFSDVSSGTYVYDVFWYINGNHVINKTNIQYKNIDISVLRHTDWNNTYRMNMEVQCAIRIRFAINSTPSRFIYSSTFQAGLYPDETEYTVIEGDYINIGFTSTVPVGCISSHNDFRKKQCYQNLYVFQPEHTKVDCSNNFIKRDIIFKAHFCGIQIGSLNWKEKQTLQVFGFSDGLYNSRDRSTYIRISAPKISMLNEMWRNIKIPEIKITVIDKDSLVTNRICQSYNDPHITTFDGRIYHYMQIGEFVIYRNQKGPYWVHVLLTNCGFGWVGSACHCGIAIRSKNSLFVFRTCQKVSRTEKHMLQQPLTQLITCDDNDLAIEHFGSDYKITLPIGTEIRFTIDTWSMFISSVSIKPSVYDINEARGLCGVPSTTRNPSDDFTHRYNGPVSDDQIFGDSWRISSSMVSEQLFIAEPYFLNNGYNVNIPADSTRYCVCEQEAGSSNSVQDFYKVQCNLTESTEYCTVNAQQTETTVSAFFHECRKSDRRKRSADSFVHDIVRRSTVDTDDIVDFIPVTFTNDVESKGDEVEATFKNDWTEEKAYLKCKESIKNALPSEMYSDFVDLKEEDFIASCVIDIKLVGNPTFLSQTIGAMVTNIMMEVVKNESLYSLVTADGSQTLLEYITSFLCPNNCSNNGNCTAGVCVCYEEYAGDDCSQQLSTPPSNISLPTNGVCTLGTRACVKTNVYGIFPSKNVWYKLKHSQIHDNSTIDTSESDDLIFRAEYRNFFMISVNLRASRGKRSTSQTIMADVYDISLSNDQLNFGNPVSIIIYDENYYCCNLTSLSCRNESCMPGILQTETPKDNQQSMAIGISVGLVLVATLAVISVICCKSKKSKDKVNITEREQNCTSPDNQMVSSDIWMKRENTLSEVDFDIGNCRPETPVDLFVVESTKNYYNNNRNTKFNPSALSNRISK